MTNNKQSMGDMQFNGTPEEWEALVKKNKMNNNKQNSEEQTQGYICPVTKVQCDDECCVSAEDCHIKAWDQINSSNNKQSSSVEWLIQKLIEHQIIKVGQTTYGGNVNYKHEILLDQAKAMHKEEIEDAWDKGDYCIDLPDGTWEQKYKSAEQYYNETFGGNK